MAVLLRRGPGCARPRAATAGVPPLDAGVKVKDSAPEHRRGMRKRRAPARVERIGERRRERPAEHREREQDRDPDGGLDP